MTQAQHHEALRRVGAVAIRLAREGDRHAAETVRAMSARILELESQLAAIGAGGVEPLRKCLHQIAEPGCTRSHPHEAMSPECRIRAVIAEMRNREARGAEATEHCLGRFADVLERALADRAMQAQAAPAPTTEQAAHDMGAKGAPATEAERLLFEAWMRGHCWALSATWNGKEYRSDSEHPGHVDPLAMRTRGLWAAWRDRAALAAAPQPPVAAQEPAASVYTMEALVPGAHAKCHATLHKPLPAGTKLYTHPAPQPAPVAQRDAEDAASWRVINEQFIDDYLEDYELIGEAEGVGDCRYTPTETERDLIKDAVMGLLAVAEDAARSQTKQGGV